MHTLRKSPQQLVSTVSEIRQERWARVQAHRGGDLKARTGTYRRCRSSRLQGRRDVNTRMPLRQENLEEA